MTIHVLWAHLFDIGDDIRVQILDMCHLDRLGGIYHRIQNRDFAITLAGKNAE